MNTYPIILVLHSLVRWLVLASLVYTIFRAYRGWLTNQPFSKLDNSARHITATIAHFQLLLGLGLYFISPLVKYFMENFKDAMHLREIRFFGMEHITMMVIGIIVITIGSVKTKRKTDDRKKFKTMAIWYTIALVIILSSVPWPFSPLISRPYFRWF